MALLHTIANSDSTPSNLPQPTPLCPLVPSNTKCCIAMLRRGGGQLGHGHAGHVAQPDSLPSLPLHLCPGPSATARHRALLRHPSTSTVELDDDNGRRSRAQISSGRRSRRASTCMDTLSTRAAPPPCTCPGPACNALSITTPPGRRQTWPRPDPGPPPPWTGKKIRRCRDLPGSNATQPSLPRPSCRCH
jgi:hypothetical protein